VKDKSLDLESKTGSSLERIEIFLPQGLKARLDLIPLIGLHYPSGEFQDHDQ